MALLTFFISVAIVEFWAVCETLSLIQVKASFAAQTVVGRASRASETGDMAEQACLFNAISVISVQAGGLAFAFKEESSLEAGSAVTFSGSSAGLAQRLTILARSCGGICIVTVRTGGRTLSLKEKESLYTRRALIVKRPCTVKTRRRAVLALSAGTVSEVPLRTRQSTNTSTVKEESACWTRQTRCI